jgi:acetate kinase
MKVLTLNCGSSSVKYALFNMPGNQKLCHGLVHRVGLGGSLIEHVKGDTQTTHGQECPTHAAAIKLVIEFLTDPERGAVKTLSEIRAVGHRVVHGGDKFASPVFIDGAVIKAIEEYSELAPLHNPINLAGIRAITDLMPGIPQIAVFDTAFFTRIPPHVFIYGVPYEWYEKYHIRRYGFHGTSHRYVAGRAAVLLGKNPEAVNLITLHIGNGVSLTAVKNGVAYDHSMGFTPLEGAVMGTRCGDIDPGMLLYVMGKENLAPQEMEAILNRKSGLLGITGKHSDRRDILRAMDAGDKRAKLSFEIECYRLRKYIGAYTAALGGVDAIVFTAGVGENSFLHREKVCEGLETLGIELSSQKNKQAVGGQKETEISEPRSRVKVFVIPTNEELMIAEDTFELVGGK